MIHQGFDGGMSVTSSPALTRLFKSFARERPPVQRLLPPWSLTEVLKVLAKPPFEPLSKASLKHLTMKTVFLLAIASGRRRSAIHALSSAEGHIRWEPSGVRLLPKPGFVAKNQDALSGGLDIVLRAISEVSSVAEDKVWCPVRALKYYVRETEELRHDSQLFIITREPFNPASKSTISRWIVDTILKAGPSVLSKELAPGATPRAHDTRSVSASWALFQGVKLSEIQRAASWASANTFINCYLRDVPAAEGSFSVAALGGAAAAAR